MGLENLKTPPRKIAGELRLTAEQIGLLDETFEQLTVNRKRARAFADLSEQLEALKADLPAETGKPAA